jgi:hypothetical protein
MKLETAIKQIHKEAAFVGWSVPDIIKDIGLHGKMIYPERTVEAYKVLQDKFYIRAEND